MKRRHFGQSLPLSPVGPPRRKMTKPAKRAKREEVIVQREPAEKFRLTRDDVFRSVNGRGYDQR